MMRDFVVRRFRRSAPWLAFAAVGAHECAIDGAPPIRLAPRHTLVVERQRGEADAPLAIRPLDAAGVALAVRIECR